MLITNFEKPLLHLSNPDSDTADYVRIASKLMRKNITSDSRDKDVVIGRQIVMWWLRNEKKYSLQKAADTFKMGHSNAIHANKAINNLIDTRDKKYYPVLIEFLKQAKLK